MPQTTGEEPVGSVAEEAVRLVHALLNDSRPIQHSTCTWCPLCQLANTVRDNPEALESALAAATSFVDSARALFDVAMAQRKAPDPS